MKKIIYILTLLTYVNLAFGQPDKKVLDAFAHYENGQYSEATQLFLEIAKEKSASASKYQYYCGLAYYKQGDYNNALSEFELAREGGFMEAILWIAKVYSINGDIQNAISYLSTYLNSEQAIDINTVKKDVAFRSLHNSDKWFELWQEENLRPEQIASIDAKYYLDKNQFTQAHQTLDNQINYGNTSAELYALNSKAYATEGIQQLAIDEINKALKIEENNTRYLLLKAAYLENCDRVSDALEILNDVLEISPEDFSTRYKRANLAFAVGEYNLAKSDLEILTKYFMNAEYEFLLGETYYKLENYVSALKTFNHIMEREKPKAEYYKARGMTYYQTRIFDQAAYDLSMSLDLSPTDPETNLYLGLSEKNRGNSEMACYYLQRAKNCGSKEAVNYLNSSCK